MPDENNKSFSGIFSSLRKLIFVDPPEEEQPVSRQGLPASVSLDQKLDAPINIGKEPSKTTISAAPPAGGQRSSDDMVNKIYALLETINKPGIDFFEFWNAASAMGGTTPSNLQNAYTALNVLGLTKEKILSSGQAYKQELSQRLNEEINRKSAEKTGLETKLRNERVQLEQQKKDTEEKIQQLTASLTDINSRLVQLDSQYKPQLDAINTRIEAGGQALETVLNEMQAVLDTVTNSVN